MKTAICTIAKNENAYINDWVNYHLNLGFDYIYIYDNNDSEMQYIGNIIERINDVKIISWHKEKIHFFNQIAAYDDFIKKYSSLYDWCAFIDIDEFINLNTNDLKSFLEKAPKECNYIGLVWKIFGDDDIIDGNENVPVYNRFFNERYTIVSRYFKSIIRTKNIKNLNNIYPMSCHAFCDNTNVLNYYDYNFNKINVNELFINKAYEDIKNDECYISHYITKTLSEFIKYKYPIFTDSKMMFGGNNPFDYFFAVNDITEGKINYIKEKTGIELKYI